MKEHPIIFNTENVKAILEDRKTMTRRVIVPQPIKKGNLWEYGNSSSKGVSLPLCIGVDEKQLIECMLRRCPYGQVGDRLWVRETWRIVGNDSGNLALEIQYKSDMSRKWFTVSQATFDKYTYDSVGWVANSKWRSSRFMPKWAVRIWLEITGVRVERLQEIRIADAEAETGIKFDPIRDWSPEDCLSRFDSLWDSLNAKRGYGWDSNPWVWVLEFKKVV